jgi:hypothetical protein
MEGRDPNAENTTEVRIGSAFYLKANITHLERHLALSANNLLNFS